MIPAFVFVSEFVSFLLNQSMKKTILLFLFATMTAAVLPRSGAAFCFEEAGSRYGVPPGLLWAIAKVESNFNPTALNQNRNGSYDIGVMQINSSWYNDLGPELWNNLYDPCTNVQVGARILADCLGRYGYSWEGIGCYNAMSIDKRAIYARKVIHVLNDMHRKAAALAASGEKNGPGA